MRALRVLLVAVNLPPGRISDGARSVSPELLRLIDATSKAGGGDCGAAAAAAPASRIVVASVGFMRESGSILRRDPVFLLDHDEVERRLARLQAKSDLLDVAQDRPGRRAVGCGSALGPLPALLLRRYPHPRRSQLLHEEVAHR